jgi:hypothetical protein
VIQDAYRAASNCLQGQQACMQKQAAFNEFDLRTDATFAFVIKDMNYYWILIPASL